MFKSGAYIDGSTRGGQHDNRCACIMHRSGQHRRTTCGVQIGKEGGEATRLLLAVCRMGSTTDHGVSLQTDIHSRTTGICGTPTRAPEAPPNISRDVCFPRTLNFENRAQKLPHQSKRLLFSPSSNVLQKFGHVKSQQQWLVPPPDHSFARNGESPSPPIPAWASLPFDLPRVHDCLSSHRPPDRTLRH